MATIRVATHNFDNFFRVPTLCMATTWVLGGVSWCSAARIWILFGGHCSVWGRSRGAIGASKRLSWGAGLGDLHMVALLLAPRFQTWRCVGKVPFCWGAHASLPGAFGVGLEVGERRGYHRISNSPHGRPSGGEGLTEYGRVPIFFSGNSPMGVVL